MAGTDGAPSREELILELLRSAEARRLVAEVLPPLLREWAGSSRFRRLAARVAARIVVSPPGDGEAGLAELLGDPAKARYLAAHLPALIGAAVGGATALTEALVALPDEEKARLLRDSLAGIDWGRLGGLATALARMASGAHASAPNAVADAVTPALVAFLDGVDTAELATAAEAIADEAVAVAERFHAELWRRPAKAICLLSALPPLLGSGLRGAAKTVEPLNGLAPDLVADVVNSLLAEVKGRDVGALVDQLTELLRKLHVGSELIGEDGRSRLSAHLARLLGEIVDSMDVERLVQARDLLAETREAAGRALADLAASRPALARDLLAAPARAASARARRIALEAEAVDQALPDDELARAAAQARAALDPAALAEAWNALLALANRLHALEPDLLRSALSQLFGGLDEAELVEAVDWLAEEAVAALRPMAPRLMPPLIRGLAELLGEARREPGPLRDALDELRDALQGAEAEA